MSGLNPPQQAAVDTLSGPMLVLAGAGTGKTRVITYRIANLIKSGIAGERILGMTFTNKAAKEMRDRLGAMIGKPNRKSKRKSKGRENACFPTLSTFHSLCVRILRRHIRKLGYPAKFAIFDQGDQESLARTILKDLDIGDIKPSQLLFWISHWKSRGVVPEDLHDLEPG